MSYINKAVPQEIKRWNWGAFVFNIAWGFGSRSYLPLLILIPFFGFIWLFVCGFKGNEWAWKNGDYDSIDTFMKVQETWNRAGFICFILWVISIVVMFFFMSAMMAAIAGAAY